MTMTASLTATSASGNEMPGYPRVNSVPPRSLNCNGYPGSEYGGNSINTTANNNAITNTSSSQTSTNGNQTMHPPQIPQSPNRQQQPPRPNSNQQMYQQQSPNHYNNNSMHIGSPTTPQNQQSPHHSNSESTTPNHYPTSGMITPTSHHAHLQDNQQEWGAWNNGTNQSQTGDLYNQSDRINLNTRLKTMILNKNDKDQSQQQQQNQSQTGHFLSFSHQHLHADHQQSHLNSNNVNNNPTNDGGGGGFLNNNNNNNEKAPTTMENWKTSPIKQEEQKNKQQDFFEQKQQINEKNIGDPGGGILANEKESPPLKTPIEEEIDKEQDASKLHLQPPQMLDASITNYSNDSNHPNTYPQQNLLGYSDTKSDTKHSTILPNDSAKNSSYMPSYNSASEYAQHQNMINSIKKEPNEDPSAPIKTEGYEKNYQNFIRYADFCDAQTPHYQDHQKPPTMAQYQQEYMQQQQNYYNNYPYQNYPHHAQNYPPQNYNQYMSQQSYQQQGHPPPHTSATVASLTNFEQQIPLHTYPIPKHSKGEQILPPSSIKSEPLPPMTQESHQMKPCGPIHPYPFMSEGASVSNMKQDPSTFACCRPGGTPNSTPDHIQHGNFGGMPPKDDLIKEEPEEELEDEMEKLPEKPTHTTNSRSNSKKQQPAKDVHNERNNKPEVPECDCFPSDKNPPEPGSYYTHLGK